MVQGSTFLNHNIHTLKRCVIRHLNYFRVNFKIKKLGCWIKVFYRLSYLSTFIGPCKTFSHYSLLIEIIYPLKRYVDIKILTRNVYICQFLWLDSSLSTLYTIFTVLSSHPLTTSQKILLSCWPFSEPLFYIRGSMKCFIIQGPPYCRRIKPHTRRYWHKTVNEKKKM